MHIIDIIAHIAINAINATNYKRPFGPLERGLWPALIMDYAYRYGDRGRLYLNTTNRCANRCAFCIRNSAVDFGAAELWGDHEPDIHMLKNAIQQHGNLEDFTEFIWCGYGEPTFRLDLIVEAASWLRSRGASVRLNTNGQACLIHSRDVLPELGGAVDVVSVSLNAPNAARYLELCRPDPDDFPDPGKIRTSPEITWEAMLDFLRRAPAYFSMVQASVIGLSLTSAEIEQSRELAFSLGIKQFLIR